MFFFSWSLEIVPKNLPAAKICREILKLLIFIIPTFIHECNKFSLILCIIIAKLLPVKFLVLYAVDDS